MYVYMYAHMHKTNDNITAFTVHMTLMVVFLPNVTLAVGSILTELMPTLCQICAPRSLALMSDDSAWFFSPSLVIFVLRHKTWS